MEVHIYSVKAKKPKIKWKHKKAKAARYSARDLKHLHVLRENPVESAAGFTLYLSLRKHPKLGGSKKGTVGA